MPQRISCRQTRRKSNSTDLFVDWCFRPQHGSPEESSQAPVVCRASAALFEKGFIKAEVISFDDLVETGSVAEAHSKGMARVDGTEYVMQDGDVVEVRFNV
ncbi:hypothetical protein ABMA10_14610 [Plantibacter sp. RU18]